MTMIKCNICGKEYLKKKSMTNHRRWHKIPEYEKFQEMHNKNLSVSKKGEKNSAWKGDKVSYKGLHIWIRNNKPKKNLCEKCGLNKKVDASNISGEYKRDLNDWEWLCKKCHIRKDKKKFKNIEDYPTKRAQLLVLDNRKRRKLYYYGNMD